MFVHISNQRYDRNPRSLPSSFPFSFFFLFPFSTPSTLPRRRRKRENWKGSKRAAGRGCVEIRHKTGKRVTRNSDRGRRGVETGLVRFPFSLPPPPPSPFLFSYFISSLFCCPFFSLSFFFSIPEFTLSRVIPLRAGSPVCSVLSLSIYTYIATISRFIPLPPFPSNSTLYVPSYLYLLFFLYKTEKKESAKMFFFFFSFHLYS